MKKRVFLSIVLILLVVFTSVAYATQDAEVMPINEDVESSEEEAIPEGTTEEPTMEIISNSHFMAEENPSLQDAGIDGNLFAFGTNISLNNVVVYGDIFVAGQNITFSNITVYGTAFLAGETINMNNANFAGNIFSASQTMNFTGIVQDVFAASENISLNEESIVARDVFAAASRIVLSGNVGKNANVSGEEIIVMANANIAGTLNYSSTQEAGIALESTIGNVNFNKIEEVENTTTSTVNIGAYNVVVIAIKSIFVCGFIFLFAKGFMERQKVQNVLSYVAKNTVKGFGWAVIIPVIGFMLLFTGVSVGLSFTVFALYSIIFWASVPIVATTITANIPVKQQDNVWKFYGYSILISIILAVLKQIPTVGGIITVVVGLAGMGIVMSSLRNKKAKVEDTEKVESEVIE